MDLTSLSPHAFNALLIVVVGFFLRHTLANIEHRIMRIEDTFFPKAK